MPKISLTRGQEEILDAPDGVPVDHVNGDDRAALEHFGEFARLNLPEVAHG